MKQCLRHHLGGTQAFRGPRGLRHQFLLLSAHLFPLVTTVTSGSLFTGRPLKGRDGCVDVKLEAMMAQVQWEKNGERDLSLAYLRARRSFGSYDLRERESHRPIG